jgi:hypothetical protein
LFRRTDTTESPQRRHIDDHEAQGFNSYQSGSLADCKRDAGSADRVLRFPLSSAEVVTVMYAAWALIVALAGNADEIDLDVIVGTRVPAIGPLIAQLSVRKEVAGTRTVSDYLKSVRRELSLNSRL